MAWPTPQDYNEAVQNPRLTFSDPELQGGRCEVTALGLPKPITGSFASVYRFHCGGRDWAVRCFWRELTDMQQRYRAISAHLATAGLSYTVGFEYQPQGIRVRGTWYPILKMEWIDGTLLNDFLVSHLQDPIAFQALSDRWLAMVSDLERAGCAHGDLQHGNVLVVNGELKLVDYDGMYVPALAGMGSHELGQQHYQHPSRSAADFGPQLDRFSTWVIYLSVSALQVDPSLWTSTQAGDERLLLQRRDFESPESSASLALLTNHPDPGLQSLAMKFRAALDQPVDLVPSLPAALRPAGAESEHNPLPTGWLPLRLHLTWRSLAPSSETGAAAPAGPRPGSHPDWVIDHLPARLDELPEGSGRPIGTARMASLAAFPLAGCGVVALIAAGIPLVVAAVLLVLVWSVGSMVACIVAYRQEPAVQELLPLVRHEAQTIRRLAAAERAARTITARKEALLRHNIRDREEAAARKTELQRQERAELDMLQEKLTARLEALDLRIHDVDRREIEEVELTLAEIQKRHIAECLRRASLRSASIPGIGMSVKMRLWSLGVWAAADVSSEKIRSMQHLKHDHLMEVVAWRVGTETAARRTMPQQLSVERKLALHRRYALERTALVGERSDEQASTQKTMEEVQLSFARRLARIDDHLTGLLNDRTQAFAGLEAQLVQVAELQRGDSASLSAVRREIEESATVSFGGFARAVYLPWSSVERA